MEPNAHEAEPQVERLLIHSKELLEESQRISDRLSASIERQKKASARAQAFLEYQNSLLERNPSG